MLTFHEACRAIIANQNLKALDYAVAYARAGLGMSDRHEQAVQALYILNNMQYWRGDLAKQVRDALKRASKEA